MAGAERRLVLVCAGILTVMIDKPLGLIRHYPQSHGEGRQWCVRTLVLVFARSILPRMSSASLVQANGTGCSFQLSMNAPIVLTSSLTEVKEPRRMAWRVITEKKHSTRLSQEQLAGVKCKVTRGFFASQALTAACL